MREMTFEEARKYLSRHRQGLSMVKTEKGYVEGGKDLQTGKWYLSLFSGCNIVGSDAFYGCTFYEGRNLIEGIEV